MSQLSKITVLIILLSVANATFAQAPVPQSVAPTSGAQAAEPQNPPPEDQEKIAREQAEKLAAEKRLQDEAAKKKAKIYAGVVGTLGLSLNAIHGLGYGFGATFGGVLFERFGWGLGFSTGQVKTKSAQFKAGNSTLTLKDGNTLGFLEFNLTAAYVFPRISGIGLAAGAGLQLYSLGSPSVSMSNMFAPLVSISAHYRLLNRLELGVITNFVLAGLSSVSSGYTAYALDSRQSLLSVNLLMSVRYQLQ